MEHICQEERWVSLKKDGKVEAFETLGGDALRQCYLLIMICAAAQDVHTATSNFHCCLHGRFSGHILLVCV